MSDHPPASASLMRRSGSQSRQRCSLAGMACTPAERAELEQRAERAGMSVSAYMRHQCLGTAGPRAVRRPPVEKKALAQLLGQLGKAGGNLNQVARALNSDRGTPADIAETLAEIKAAARAISDTLSGGKAP
ncbi:plasmid mobilization protein [Roseicella aquatilis]|uniref:Plasmid mobilization relaxosome protein MobC n=1 Tax=Roseicella aquatilis TaxID=2527868 RepID=A0A4R4D5D8_9PROT|nr:plasmid mobilization relaxosome protein MobC [Roseicella aquatilis]TCZ51912.1 plasmid mobilization relaxosome protein MobC [Roseicella aquatilis]